MSRKQKPRKPADDYKRGYMNGVMAAVDALLDDLGDAGRLAGEEYGEDGRSLRCKGCTVMAQGFAHVSDRWTFAVGLHKQHQ